MVSTAEIAVNAALLTMVHTQRHLSLCPYPAGIDVSSGTKLCLLALDVQEHGQEPTSRTPSASLVQK